MNRILRLALAALLAAVPAAADYQQPPFEVTDPAISENFRNVYYSVDQLNAITKADGITCIDSPTFCVDPVNNFVGMGTGTPGQILHLYGSSDMAEKIETTSTDKASFLQLTNPSGVTHEIGMETQLDSGGGRYAGPGSSFNIVAGSTHPIVVSNNGTETARIDSSGVTTLKGSSNGATLIINNTAGRGGFATFQQSGTDSGGIGVSGLWLGSGASDLAITAQTGKAINFYSNGSTNAGLFLDSSGNVNVRNALKLSASGAYFIAAPTNGFRFNDSADSINILILTNAGQAQFSSGSAASPSIAFQSDASNDTGFYLGSANDVAFSAGGTKILDLTTVANGGLIMQNSADINSNRIVPNADNTYPLGTTSARFSAVWAANGTIQTSASRTKREIRELVPTTTGFILVPINENTIKPTPAPVVAVEPKVPRAIVFKWKDTAGRADDQDVIGVMGDDLPIEARAINKDGSRDPDNFYTSGVIGLQSAAIRDLQNRVAVLENELKLIKEKSK